MLFFTIHHPVTKNETILGKFETLCKIDEKLIRHKKLNGKSLITFKEEIQNPLKLRKKHLFCTEP